MGVKNWIQTEYECDFCGVKARLPDDTVTSDALDKSEIAEPHNIPLGMYVANVYCNPAQPQLAPNGPRYNYLDGQQLIICEQCMPREKALPE